MFITPHPFPFSPCFLLRDNLIYPAAYCNLFMKIYFISQQSSQTKKTVPSSLDWCVSHSQAAAARCYPWSWCLANVPCRCSGEVGERHRFWPHLGEIVGFCRLKMRVPAPHIHPLINSTVICSTYLPLCQA